MLSAEERRSMRSEGGDRLRRDNLREARRVNRVTLSPAEWLDFLSGTTAILGQWAVPRRRRSAVGGRFLL